MEVYVHYALETLEIYLCGYQWFKIIDIIWKRVFIQFFECIMLLNL